MPTKFRIGDRVEDRESGKPGRVVHVYREIDLRDDVATASMRWPFRLTASAK
jgi:hypothetical protein